MSRKKTLRVDHVKNMLLGKKTVTAQELATSLNTSRRTIYRYMEELKKEGFGVEACPGSAGGFRLQQEKTAPHSMFTGREALALMLAAITVAEHNLLPNAEILDSAIEKIRESLTPDQWAQIQETMPNISIILRKLYCQDKTEEWLAIATEAVASRKSVLADYYSFSTDQENTRRIDPYHLLFQGGAWYVVGYCHLRQAMRTFRVDRIRQMSLSEDSFIRSKSFNLNDYLGASWGIMRGERTRVQILFYPPASRLVAESRWHSSQQATWLEDQRLLFETEVDGLDEVKGWVLTFGESAEVLSPDSLRQSIAESVARAAARYQTH
jgi:predicted DNA-binding transcriptional regulator YafY